MTYDPSKSQPNLLYERMVVHGRVCASRLADAFDVTESELAASIGLSGVAIRHEEDSPSTQHRLHELVEILDRVISWGETDLQAYAWYRSEPLPSFGNRIAADLVKEGLSGAVKTHLSRIAIGGYA